MHTLLVNDGRKAQVMTHVEVHMFKGNMVPFEYKFRKHILYSVTWF